MFYVKHLIFMNKSLNTFRTFAFLSVFLFHIGIFPFGYIGVHAFFVLSGYLIMPIILKTKIETGSIKGFFVNFYGRRSLRIFPPYYLYLFFMTVIIMITGLSKIGNYQLFINQLPWAATYTYNFFHASIYFHVSPLVSHFWSLAVEEQFYIFFPFVMYFLSEISLKRFLIALIIIGPIIRFLIGFIVDHHLMPILFHEKDITVYVLPFSHLDAFAIGGFSSLYLRKYRPSNITITIVTTLIILIGAITSKISTHDFHTFGLGYQPFMKDSFKYVWGYTTFSCYFSLILLRLNRRDLVTYIFENTILNYLGKISYGLYIYHFAIINVIKQNHQLLPYYPSSVILQQVYVAILGLPITIIISIFSFELFEKIFLKWKDIYFPKIHKQLAGK